MKMRIKRIYFGLAIVVLIGGLVWAWCAATWTREAETSSGRSAALPAPVGKDLRVGPIEPVRMHLVPRTQPTPLSASCSSPRPPN